VCVCVNEERHKKATQCMANKRFLRLSCAPFSLPFLPLPLRMQQSTLVPCHYRSPLEHPLRPPHPLSLLPPSAFFFRQLRAFMLGFGFPLRLPNAARRQRRRRSRVQLELDCLTVRLLAFLPRDLRAFRTRFSQSVGWFGGVCGINFK